MQFIKKSSMALAGVLSLSASLTSISALADDLANSNTNPNTLQKIVNAQSAEHKARHEFRHPTETLQFFGIEPGMTVVEAMPGGGWYSKILAPYLGSEGTLIAANYPDSIWPNFSWASQEFIDKRIASTKAFPDQVKTWAPTNTPKSAGYTFATLPETLNNSVDAVLMIRALHNMAAFNASGQFLDNALVETHRILKPGGIVGVVQHSSTEAVDGSTGYLNQDDLVGVMNKAGFTLVKSSAINANPKDQAKADDIVWRLPPTYATSGNDVDKKKAFSEIGESNRMTLVFKKSVKS